MAEEDSSTGWVVFLGVALGIFSAVASNIGTNTQKYGFMQEASKEVVRRRHYVQQPLWWVGFVLVVLGAIGDLFSFSLAPQSLVAPTGSFTLVSNVIFAHFWLGEELTTRDLVGTAMVVTGAVISVSFGSHEETAYSIAQLQELYLQPSMAVYGIFILLLWGSLVWLIHHAEHTLRESGAGTAAGVEALSPRSGGSQDGDGGGMSPLAEDSDGAAQAAAPSGDASSSPSSSGAPSAPSKQAVDLARVTAGLREPPEAYARWARWHPLAYAAMAGSIGGQTVMFAKSMGEIVKATAAGSNQFVYAFTYVILVCMIGCMVGEQHFLASGLQLFDAMLVVPVFSSAFMLVTVLGGAAYFDELNGFDTLSWVLFPLGIVLVVSGVLILSARRQDGGRGAGKQPGGEEDEQGAAAPRHEEDGDGSLGGGQGRQAGGDGDIEMASLAGSPHHRPAASHHDVLVMEEQEEADGEAWGPGGAAGTSAHPSPASTPRRPVASLSARSSPGHVASSPKSSSSPGRRPSLLRPGWEAVVSRPRGPSLLSFHRASSEHPSPLGASPRSARPRSSTEAVATTTTSAAGGAAAGGLPGHHSPTTHGRRPRGRTSVLEATLHIMQAVTLSHTVVSAFNDGQRDAPRPVLKRTVSASAGSDPALPRAQPALPRSSTAAVMTATAEPVSSLPPPRAAAAASPAGTVSPTAAATATPPAAGASWPQGSDVESGGGAAGANLDDALAAATSADTAPDVAGAPDAAALERPDSPSDGDTDDGEEEDEGGPEERGDADAAPSPAEPEPRASDSAQAAGGLPRRASSDRDDGLVTGGSEKSEVAAALDAEAE